MSGPKCGQYSVKATAEMRRRRLLAAQDRYQRAQASLAAVAGELKAATLTYGRLPVALPAALEPPGTDPEEWEQAADGLAADIERWHRQIGQAVVAARAQHFASGAASVTASPAPSPSSPAPSPSPATAHPPAPARRAAPVATGELARVLGRLPAQAGADGVARAEALARDWHQAPHQHQRDQVLSALRLVVQGEQDRARATQANRLRLEALYGQLDGLSGPAVESMRGQLRGLSAEALPDDLESRVAEIARAARAGQDRDYVLRAAGQALAELGYVVGDDFCTAVPRGGALVDLPHSHHHGLLVRERDHQLLLNVVRYDGSGALDPGADAQAETRFCGDFSQLRAALDDRGIELEMWRADAPGATPVQVLEAPRRRPARPRAQPASRRAREPGS